MAAFNLQFSLNGYANGYYGGITPSQYQKMLQGQNNVLKLKYSIAGACFNKQYTDSELERIVNPRARMQQMSKEEFWNEVENSKG